MFLNGFSSRLGSRRMVLSQKEKEVAKMGLPVFTVSLFTSLKQHIKFISAWFTLWYIKYYKYLQHHKTEASSETAMKKPPQYEEKGGIEQRSVHFETFIVLIAHCIKVYQCMNNLQQIIIMINFDCRNESKKKKKEKKSKKDKKKKEKKKKRQRRDSSSSDSDDNRKRFVHFLICAWRCAESITNSALDLFWSSFSSRI